MPEKTSVLISGNRTLTTELKSAISEINNTFAIDMADSGKKALEAASGKKYDVICSFFTLSDMKGLELYQELIKNKITSPFILMYDQGDERETLKALNEGAKYYVQELKPLEILSRELAEKAGTVTRRIKEESQECRPDARALRYFRESPEGIFVVDGTGHFTDVNPSACNLTGYSKEELLTLSIADIHDSSSLESGMEKFRECSGTGYVQGEFLSVHKDGSTFFLSVNGVQSGPDEYVAFCRDTTENRKTLEALKESEERYRILLEGVPDYILVHSNGKILYVNQAVLNIVDLKLDQMIGLDIMDFTAPKSRETVLSMMKKRAKNDIIPTYEIVIQTKLGPRNTEIHGALITYEGKPASIIVMTDITEKKEAEQKLQKSREQYQRLIEDINEMVYTVDKDGIVTYISPASEMIVGLKPEQIVGKSFFEFIYPDDLEMVKVYFQRLLRGISEYKTIRSVDSEGGTHYLRFSGHIITEDNTVTGLTGTISDFTSEIIAGNELLESEQRFRSMFENSPFAYQSLDKEGRFIDINAEWTKLTGYSRDEVIGTFFGDYWPDDCYEQGKKKFSAAMEKGEVTTEIRLKNKEGTVKTVLLNGKIQRDGEGTFVRTHCILNDITERKNAEEAVKEANKKLNLLGSITRHDIINQVSAAQMFVDVIEIEGKIPPDSKTAEDLKIIAGALETIERQIVFTRDYQDLGIQSPDWYPVGAIVETVASGGFELLNVENEVKNLEIYADPLFEKVIFNLFDNAVRHGQKITLIRFTSEETPEGLKLICEDDGVGVPSDVKEKIFNRQYYQHTGLGLFLSREILSITGMSITETGVPGEGARFEISVPDGLWRLV